MSGLQPARDAREVGERGAELADKPVVGRAWVGFGFGFGFGFGLGLGLGLVLVLGMGLGLG